MLHPLGWDDGGRGQVAFIPGTWMRESSWASWQAVFDRNGYDSVVLGHAGPDSADNAPSTASGEGVTFRATLRGLLAECSSRLDGMAERPILIGHGLGALLAQLLLEHGGLASAAIALSPVRAGWVSWAAPAGICRSALTFGTARRSPDCRITAEAFAHVYANTTTTAEAVDLYQRYVVAGSARPAVQAAWALRAPARTAPTESRPPLLLISGGKDRLTPETTGRSWERHGRRRHPDSVTDHHVFPDRGHSLVIDAGAEDVANFCLDWLSSQNL